MKRTYIVSGILLAAAMTFMGCSDDFLEEKKVYGKFGETDVYSSYTSAMERCNSLYHLMLPQACQGSGNGGNSNNNYTSTGYADTQAKSAWEYAGLTDWVNPNKVLDYTSVIDYFYVENKSVSPWGNIRDCNDIIEHAEDMEVLTDEERNNILGQAYFWRAFRYWNLVKWYGGVPIIDYVQDPVIGDGDGSDKIVARSSAKDCIEFICNDLEMAANMLPTRWENENSDYGRITAGCAEALKGRVQLFWASPIFNRANASERWDSAYASNKRALELLQAGNYGLAYADNGGETNGANWARIFSNYTGSDGSTTEAVFITLYNNIDEVDGQEYDKWNGWEHSIRPVNANGGGSLHPTSEMVDLFPMSDGLKPGESSIAYDSKLFWLNRDPRFYRTFAFPGTEWRFDNGGLDITSFNNSTYTTGNGYQLWSYTWYDSASDAAATSSASNGFSPEALDNKNSAIYIRKKSDDLKLNTSPLYVFTINANSPKGFQQSAAPLIVMRYAEVVLDFAEAACGAGHLDEALAALQQIRARVGYTAENNYGLPTDISGDQAKLMAAILYERQVELAYEGKSFDDAKRWMLFDGGTGKVEGAPASWTLTGWGGNTCTWLGVEQLNGQRRHEMILYSTKTATEAAANDPLKASRPSTGALDLTENMTTEGLTSDSKVAAMADFYNNYLERKDYTADGNSEDNVIYFRPEYYIIGLKQSAMQNNATLYQTIGWYDYSHGTDGTFDPLAE